MAAATTQKKEGRGEHQKGRAEGPVKWGALSGSFPYFSARFFPQLFLCFSSNCFCRFGALFVAILGEDLHYNLLCENTMHPSSPPLPLHPSPFPGISIAIPLSTFPWLISMRRDVGDKKKKKHYFKWVLCAPQRRRHSSLQGGLEVAKMPKSFANLSVSKNL